MLRCACILHWNIRQSYITMQEAWFSGDLQKVVWGLPNWGPNGKAHLCANRATLSDSIKSPDKHAYPEPDGGPYVISD